MTGLVAGAAPNGPLASHTPMASGEASTVETCLKLVCRPGWRWLGIRHWEADAIEH